MSSPHVPRTFSVDDLVCDARTKLALLIRFAEADAERIGGRTRDSQSMSAIADLLTGVYESLDRLWDEYVRV